jgi:hypothetical protein
MKKNTGMSRRDLIDIKIGGGKMEKIEQTDKSKHTQKKLQK